MALIGNYGSRMLPLLARRGLATTAIKQEVHPVYFKMKETTKYFQINNGQHVSLKHILKLGCFPILIPLI